MEPNLEKKTPLHHAGKAEGLGDSLPSPQSCMLNHVDGMAGEQLIEQQKAPQLKVVEGAAILCIPSVG